MRPFKIDDGKSPKRKLPNGARLGLVDDTGNYLLDAPVVEKAYMTRFLVQATLPHTDPGDVAHWQRSNRNVMLVMQPGFCKFTKKSFGLPYGSIPRMMLLWVTTEVLRTKSRDIQLGDSLSEFMAKVGIPGSTGGKNGTITAFKSQFLRLFNTRISFHHLAEDPHRMRWQDMLIIDRGDLLWFMPEKEAAEFDGSTIRLSEQFHDAIVTGSVPLRYDALTALRRSPMAIDIYAWATYKSFTLSKSVKKTQFISWHLFAEQLGSDYARLKRFAQTAKETMNRVKEVFPEFSIEYERGGFTITGTAPSVKQKN